MPIGNEINRIFRREERRELKSLREECKQRGISPDEAGQMLRKVASDRFEEIAENVDEESSEQLLRQHVGHALRGARKTVLANFQPDPCLPYAPSSYDSAVLQDVLLAVDSFVVLLERDGLGLLFVGARGRPAYEGENAPLQYWRGADVRILNRAWAEYSGSSTLVVTEHASRLAGLFMFIRKLANPAINYLNKYEFYVRMADAANECLNKNPEVDRHDLLLETAYEARRVLEEWKCNVDETESSQSL